MSRILPFGPIAREADWDALYAEQLPRVYKFLRYRVGPDDAEDLTARVFLKAWTKRHRYRRDLAAFGTWLLVIARNEAIDHLRSRKEHEPLESADPVAAGDRPEERAGRHDDARRLTRFLRALPERERELLALKYGAGLTNRAIAKLSGLTESHVGTLLHRTIESLRRAWREEGATR
jgi:RNA polymerase sigma-70 factor (ECF subfamily)